MCIVAWPLSPNTVGHGAVAVQGAGLMTLVMTSEISVEDGAPSVAAPRMPCSESITRNDEPRPSLGATSPQETLAATAAASAR